ncbi:OsmC family protein [Candidatus Bipolaricaulota bacterium]|jgi:putative redox protein|nr:OsmC family protein [Candidatus Bipolaricaulota bacterium]TFH07187.1 MAG: osmotically inducible protein OsmC [Candidatus Atribacteria bacterium]
MKVSFPGGKKVQADYRGFTITTDQSTASGGDGSAPSPFDLFLASIGTCTGYYIMAFCQQRNIPTDGIELTMDMVHNTQRHLIERIDVRVSLPEDFPDRYVAACIKAAEQCTVKRHLQEPPEIVLTAAKS